MFCKRLRNSIVLTALLIVCGNQVSLAQRMYRWVDEDGNVYFSDRVPPEHVQHRRDRLTREGRVIETTEQAKTQEQILQEKRLEELRREQARLIARQEEYDQVLLSSYRTLADLETAIDIKMQALSLQKRTIEDNLEQLRSELRNYQKRAADFERNALPVAKDLLDKMDKTRVEIAQTQQTIVEHEAKQKEAERANKAEIDRFIFLTQQQQQKEQSKTMRANIKEASELGLFYCDNDTQCNQAWELARIFVNRHSTTGPNIDTNNLIMSRTPRRDNDLSLSVSKIAINDKEYQLFLDIRCHDSSLGRELCASPRVSELRSSFRTYINNALSSTTQ